MNKQDNIEADNKTESLTDLPLTSEQAEGAKGGPSGGGGTGKVVMQDYHFHVGSR